MAALEQSLCDGIAGLINRALRFDPDSRAQLASLAGKVICIELDTGDDAPKIFLCPTVDGIRLQAAAERPADVTIRGSVGVFAQLWRRPAAAPVGQLHISGDIELGQRFQRIVRGVDIDGEELVARYVGDAAAHQLGNLWRATGRWAAHAGATLARDSVEYLRDEAHVVASRERVNDFLNEVDRLRADVDRLGQRIDRLRGRT